MNLENFEEKLKEVEKQSEEIVDSEETAKRI